MFGSDSLGVAYQAFLMGAAAALGLIAVSPVFAVLYGLYLRRRNQLRVENRRSRAPRTFRR